MRQLLTVFIIGFGLLLGCESKEVRQYREAITKERSVKNNEFVQSEGSPFTEEDLKTFSGLKYFPVNMEFRISGQLELMPHPEPVTLQQGDTTKQMIRYAKAVFDYNSKVYKLTVFKSIPNPFQKEEDYLFIPFFDKTNGTETYEGGRYLDPEIQADGTLLLDFNKCTNPYCAYNHDYNCVVPPAENELDFEIKAGEKAYK
ncbi:DUF1684 domain-containing protein [bacterium]|nr:DUF1684 domain-containing protein [bacterium]